MDRALIPRFLPENYRFAATDRSPLMGMLAAMEEMHAPVEHILDTREAYVTPWRAPDPFVMMQAAWLGLDRYFDWGGGRPGIGTPRFRSGTDRLRLLVEIAAELNRHRGTRETLLTFLRVATGVEGFSISEGPGPFHFTVNAPAQARPLADLVARMVAGESPAHATFDIVFAAAEPAAKQAGE